MVHLVLVALALGDLDDDVNVQWFRSMPVRMVYSIVSMIRGDDPLDPRNVGCPARPSQPAVPLEKW
jgi:hypothetical protein